MKLSSHRAPASEASVAAAAAQLHAAAAVQLPLQTWQPLAPPQLHQQRLYCWMGGRGCGNAWVTRGEIGRAVMSHHPAALPAGTALALAIWRLSLQYGGTVTSRCTLS